MSGLKGAKRVSKNKISFFQDNILSWFEVFGRHHFSWRAKNIGAYEIVIAEALLQRTKAETVEKFYNNFLANFPSWKAIAQADTILLEQHLQPIGLHRQRAKRLKELAIEMLKLGGQFPAQRKDLETIPFFGQYMVNAIELQLFNKPSPLIDVNMARVLERYFGERKLVDIRYDPYLQRLAYKVVNHPKSKEINWAILDFAALVCKSKVPTCDICPLSSRCTFYRKNIC